jgi:hypothetical protein
MPSELLHIHHQNDGMSDEPKKRSRKWIGWAFVLLVVVYPLSEGPAIWLVTHYGLWWMGNALNALYTPIHWCAAQSQATEHAHDSYILFWIPDEP